MSKAFLRESDMPDLPEVAAPPLLPVGAKNYITREGAERLRRELTHQVENERPPLLARGADPEAKAELYRLDQRIRYLEQSLRTAEVVEHPADSVDEIRFGATVTVRDNEDVSTYRIVGVDEIDPEGGCISWLSPLARALTGARAGERITFHLPRGARSLEILSVRYS